MTLYTASFLKINLLVASRFGDALRTVQENLDAKNYYAYNPEFDVQPVPQPRNLPRI